MKIIKLKLNIALRGNVEGTVISVNADEDGVLMDKYWRRRLKDSAVDNCVEIINEIQEQSLKDKKSKE